MLCLRFSPCHARSLARAGKSTPVRPRPSTRTTTWQPGHHQDFSCGGGQAQRKHGPHPVRRQGGGPRRRRRRRWSDLTKNSLLHGAITCKLKDGRVFPAEILGEHDGYDLAMVKIPAKDLVPVKWRPAKDLKQGMWLAAVGPRRGPLAIGVVGVLPRTSGRRSAARPRPQGRLSGRGPGRRCQRRGQDQGDGGQWSRCQGGTQGGGHRRPGRPRPVSGVKSLQSNVQRHKCGFGSHPQGAARQGIPRHQGDARQSAARNSSAMPRILPAAN